MRKLQKLGSGLVAVMLALVLVLPALASAPAATYTITAPDNGHTYEIYQIFTGDYSVDEETQAEALSNLKWGQNSANRGDAAIGDAVSQAVMDVLAAVSAGSDAEKLEVITQYVDLEGTPFGTVTGGASQQVPGGYYLIKDVDGALAGEAETATLYLVQVAGDVTIDPKDSDIPTLEKKVWEDDTRGTVGPGYYEAADHTIGDTIPFKLIGSIPDMSAYSTYTYTFHDTQSAGLTLHTGSFAVYLVREENLNADLETLTPLDNAAGQYYTVNTNPGTGETFTVNFTNLKAVPNVDDYDYIVVSYTAELNQGAETGQEGNPNNVYLEFSNDPNGTGTGQTERQYVIVFTYTLNTDKTDGDTGEDLPGAKFVLLNHSGTQAALVSGDGTFLEWVDLPDGAESYTEVTLAQWDAMYEDDPETVGPDPDVVRTTGNTGNIRIAGLDDDEYLLLEIQAPEGYNLLEEPVRVSITSVINQLPFTGENQSAILTDLYAVINDDTEHPQHCSMLGLGTVTVPIANFSGTTLPETGGMGTTIFYAVGGLLALGAVVLLMARRRMNGRGE